MGHDLKLYPVVEMSCIELKKDPDWPRQKKEAGDPKNIVSSEPSSIPKEKERFIIETLGKDPVPNPL